MATGDAYARQDCSVTTDQSTGGDWTSVGCIATGTVTTSSDTNYWISCDGAVWERQDHLEIDRAPNPPRAPLGPAPVFLGHSEEALNKARKLLFEHLDEEQRESYKRDSFFELLSRDHKRRYRVYCGRAGNIWEIDAGGRMCRKICCHPTEGIPDHDTVLAQKLYLESAEEEFLRVANFS